MIQQAKTAKKLNKDDILTTEARRAVFESLMQGYNQKEAAKRAKLGFGYVRKWVTQSNVKALVRQEKAIIERKLAKKLEITREGQARKYEEHRDKAIELGQIGAANGAVAGQNRLFGLESDKTTDMAKISLAAALTLLAQQKTSQIGPGGHKTIEGEVVNVKDSSATV